MRTSLLREDGILLSEHTVHDSRTGADEPVEVRDHVHSIVHWVCSDKIWTIMRAEGVAK